MKRFNDAFKLGHYGEAETAAMEAHELDPDNTTAVAAMSIAKTQKNLKVYKAPQRTGGRTLPCVARRHGQYGAVRSQQAADRRSRNREETQRP